MPITTSRDRDSPDRIRTASRRASSRLRIDAVTAGKPSTLMRAARGIPNALVAGMQNSTSSLLSNLETLTPERLVHIYGGCHGGRNRNGGGQTNLQQPGGTPSGGTQFGGTQPSTDPTYPTGAAGGGPSGGATQFQQNPGMSGLAALLQPLQSLEQAIQSLSQSMGPTSTGTGPGTGGMTM
jgi:hypothetical protein